MTPLPQQRSRNLVVVRAGPASLHTNWLAGQTGRSWDIVVSYYDRTAYEADTSGAEKHFCPGGKWDGLHRTLNEIPDLSRYDFIWLPDDDLEASPQTINRIFALARLNDFAVCQPALTLDSYFSHFHTLACGGFSLRYTNHVEIMAPCLRRDTLKLLLPYFAKTMSGFGLDDVWCRLQPDNRLSAAILDETQVRHTRPVGRHMQSAVVQSGSTQKAEGEALKSLLGFQEYSRPACYGGIDANGKPVKGPRKTGLRMAAAHLKNWSNPPKRQQIWTGFFRMLRRQLIGKTDFSQIHLPPDASRTSDNSGQPASKDLNAHV